MFDHALTEEQKLLRDAAREFAIKRLYPNAEAFDKAERLPDDLLSELATLGYFGLTIPEEYGGMGLDAMAYALILEEFARACAGLAITLSVHNSLVAGAVRRYGTDDQKRRFLPRLASGEIGAYALTEPDAGTDAGAVRTSARPAGDHYILNGAKAFVTSADYVKMYLVFVSTDLNRGSHGLSALMVERATAGLEVGKPERKLGIKCSDTRAVAFVDSPVPKDNRLSAEGDGFKIALAQLDHGRLGVAIQALGIGEAAFAEARKYAKQRHQFGRPIAEFQAVAFKLADMKLKLDATRLLIDRAIQKLMAGERITLAVAEAKLFASETANWVANEAVQIHGGYGYMKDYPVERYFRDARVTEIYEGTSEAQRIVISRAVLSEE
ncbi:MAG: acyl-CoA dehydrogenase family protein [candidate division Zixibacteria bacterium]|nr:acyl-CoA dehydrogenase family protein [candidate division Zixibacteria bacterium]